MALAEPQHSAALFALVMVDRAETTTTSQPPLAREVLVVRREPDRLRPLDSRALLGCQHILVPVFCLVDRLVDRVGWVLAALRHLVALSVMRVLVTEPVVPEDARQVSRPTMPAARERLGISML